MTDTTIAEAERPRYRRPVARGRLPRNTLHILDLMTEHGLDYSGAAALLHISRHTVRHWMAAPAEAPAMALELLCRKLGKPVPDFLLSD